MRTGAGLPKLNKHQLVATRKPGLTLPMLDARYCNQTTIHVISMNIINNHVIWMTYVRTYLARTAPKPKLCTHMVHTCVNGCHVNVDVAF